LYPEKKGELLKTFAKTGSFLVDIKSYSLKTGRFSIKFLLKAGLCKPG